MSFLPDGVGFGVYADTSQVDTSLAQMEGTAASMASGIEDKLAGASEGMKDLGKRSSGASRGIQGLASVISLVDPRLGQVVRSVGTLARGMSVLRLGLGPAAIAVTALVSALALYQRHQAAVAEQERQDKAITDAMRDARSRLADATSDLDVEVGKLLSNEQKLNQIRQQAFLDNMPAVKEFTTKIAAQSKEAELARYQMERMKEAVVQIQQQFAAGGANQSNVNMEIEGLKAASIEYQKKRGEIEATQGQYQQFLQTTRDLIQTRKLELEQSDANTVAVKRERESTARLTRERRELASMMKEVSDIGRDAARSQMSDEQLIVAAMDDRLLKLEEIAQATHGLIDVEKAEQEVRKQAVMELGELRDQQHKDEMRRLEDERKEARAAALERLQVGTDLATSLGSLAASQFGDSKRAKIAQARLNQLLAITSALAHNPTPLGALQGAAAAASIQAQIASMRGAQPSFHRGGFADEYSARLRGGEAVLNNQGRAAIGDRAIREANSGRSQQPARITVLQQLKHRVFEPFIGEHLKAGTALRRAIRSGSTTTATGMAAD